MTFVFPDTGGADSYVIQLDTSPAFSGASLFDTLAEGNGNDTETFTLSFDLTPETWYWRVRARTSDGVNSDWSESRSIIVKRSAGFDVLTVTPSVGTVTRGASGADSFSVTVTARNPGDTLVGVSFDTVVFARASDTTVLLTDSYTVSPAAGNPDSIYPLATETFTYFVSVAGGADTGAVRLTAYFAGVDSQFLNAVADGSDSDADPGDSGVIVVNAQAEFRVIIVVGPTPNLVSQGQSGADSVLVSFTVLNAGDNAGTVAASGLAFLLSGDTDVSDSYSLVAVAGNPDSIPAGETVTFSFRVSVSDSAPTGAVDLHGTVSGTDVLAPSLTTEDTRADNIDAWTVQTPASAEILGITSAADTVFQGQTYQISVAIRNNGQADLDLAPDSVTLTFARTPGDTVVSDSFTIDTATGPSLSLISGNSVETYVFTVSVASGAETGFVTIDASCTGADANRLSLAVTDTTAAPDTKLWEVQGAGVMTLASVGAGIASVSRGQTGVVVTVSFRNTGAGAITDVETPTLRFVRNADGSGESDTGFAAVWQSASVSFPETMVIGAVETAAFVVTIADTAETGPVYLHADASGTVSGGAAFTRDTTATTPETWIVQTPAGIDVVSVTASKPLVTNNNADTVSLTVVIRNTGEATLVLTGDTATFSNSPTGDSWVKVSSARPDTLAGGETVSWVQVYRTTSDTGPVTVDQIVTGLDANDSRAIEDTTATTTASVEVDISRPFRVILTQASREFVSAGQSTAWTVTSQVQNSSTETALLNAFAFADLTFTLTAGQTGTANDYSGTAPVTFATSGDTLLAPGTTDTLIYAVTTTGDSTGTLRIDVTLRGYDINDTAQLLTFSTLGETIGFETLTVQSPAVLDIVRVIAARDSVSLGQSGADSVLVTVEVRNTGTARAVIASETLTFFRGATAVSDSFSAAPKAGNPTSIAGGASETWTYYVSVSATAETGAVRIEASFTGTDTNSGQAITDTTATAPDTWIVQAPSSLDIARVSASADTVFQGQSYTVRVTVRNLGEARLDLVETNVQPVFRRLVGDTVVSESFALTPLGGNPVAIAGGGSETYSFTAIVAGSVETGMVAIDASCTGTDANRASLVLADSTSTETKVWEVQGAGTMEIVSVLSTPWKLTLGQSNVGALLTFRNTGDGIITGVETPTLRFTRNADGTNPIETGLTAILESASRTYPDTMAIGAIETAAFRVTVTANAETGTVYLHADASGTVSGGAATTRDTAVASPDSWRLQSPAVLDIVSVTVGKALIVRNNADTIAITVVARNTGEAELTFTGDTATCSNNPSGDSWVKDSSTRPDTLAGGESVSWVQVYRTTSDTGAVTVDQTVTAVDSNDTARALLDTTATTKGTVEVDIPRPFRVIQTQTSREFVSAGQSTAWTVTSQVQNSSTETALLNAFAFADLTFTLTAGQTGTANDYSGTAPVTFATSGDTILRPGVTDTLIYAVTTTGDSTGTLRIDVTLRGYDINDTTQLLTSSTLGETVGFDTVEVQAPAALDIVRVIAARDSVTRGQSGADSVQVKVEVRNTGKARVNLTSDTLTFSLDGIAVSDSFVVVASGGNPATLSGGVTDTWTYYISVDNAASTGAVRIEASFTGTDDNSGDTVQDTTATAPDTIIVQAPAQADVVRLSSSNATVFQGQSYKVSVFVRNDGEARLDLAQDSIVLRFTLGGSTVTESYAITPEAGNPTGVNGGSGDTYSYSVAINAQADTGFADIDASCTGADGNRTSLAVVAASAAPDTVLWDVQGAGVLDLVSVAADSAIVSRGQSGVIVTATFRNIGQGIVTNIAAPSFLAAQGGSDLSSQYTATLQSADTTFPIATLPIGGAVNCTYLVAVSSTATTGSAAISINVAGTVSGGAATSSDSTPTTGDTWTVQTASRIEVLSVMVTADTFLMQDGIETGVTNDTFRMIAILSNTGQATATVTIDSTDVKFTNASGEDISVHFHAAVTTSVDTIAGGETATLVFTATIPDSRTSVAVGVVSVNLAANRPAARDVNSGADASDADGAASPDTFSLLVAPNTAAGDTITAVNGGETVVIALPAGKYPAGTNFNFVFDPIAAMLTSANEVLASNPNMRNAGNLESTIVEITASSAALDATRNIDVRITFETTGLTSADFGQLRIVKLNEATATWELAVEEDSQTVNHADSSVTALTNGFSFFRIVVFVPNSANLNSFRIGPNPFRPNDNNAATGRAYDGTAGSGIYFSNLPQRVRIEIYSIHGEKVAEFASENSGGQIQWDVRNTARRELASGYYIYRVRDMATGQTVTGKLAVIR